MVFPVSLPTLSKIIYHVLLDSFAGVWSHVLQQENKELFQRQNTRLQDEAETPDQREDRERYGIARKPHGSLAKPFHEELEKARARDH